MGVAEDKVDVGSLLGFFFKDVLGVSSTTTIPSHLEDKDTFSRLIRGLLKLTHIHPGHITYFLSVKPPASVISLSLSPSLPRKMGFLC